MVPPLLLPDSMFLRMFDSFLNMICFEEMEEGAVKMVS